MERLFFRGSINFLSGFSLDFATRKEALESAVKAIDPDTLDKALPLLALFKWDMHKTLMFNSSARDAKGARVALTSVFLLESILPR